MMEKSTVKWQAFFVLGLSWSLYGCSTAPQPRALTYAESISGRPVPQDDAARARECSMLNSEIQRQMGAMSYASSPAMPPQQRGKLLSEAHNNIAVLKARALTIKCSAPYNIPPAAAPIAPR